jgi:DNA-binding XRE family transcriptional regulator
VYIGSKTEVADQRLFARLYYDFVTKRDEFLDYATEGRFWMVRHIAFAIARTTQTQEAVQLMVCFGLSVAAKDLDECDHCGAIVPKSYLRGHGPNDIIVVVFCADYPCLITTEENEDVEVATLGERVKKCRIDRFITRQELAEKAGLSEVMIAKIEQGVRNPSMKSLRAIAKALGVEVSDLR